MKLQLRRLSIAASLAAAMALGVVGCAHSSMTNGSASTISVHADHNNVQVGETVWVHATTMNLTNSNIKWKVTPSSATITPDSSRGNQYAKFSASQPGGYMVKAYAKTSDGQWVTSQTNIMVTGMSNQ